MKGNKNTKPPTEARRGRFRVGGELVFVAAVAVLIGPVVRHLEN